MLNEWNVFLSRNKRNWLKFIIQGYTFSQKTINSLKNRKVYLESESGELIELNLEEFYTG